MSTSGFRLRHLVFHGPNRDAASVEFGPGLNVIYGASDTGKSFVVEAIDFMLGGKPPLRDIPERIGYDRVLLGIETITGESFTLLRSADGGCFQVYTGLHLEPPGNESESYELSKQHSGKKRNNLSTFLLEKCGLAGKRIRRNKDGFTNSLGFRNLARLLVVTETEITSQRSPLSDGNPITDTPNFAAFKLLLTGVDDSALIANKESIPIDRSRGAQVELLDQLIGDYRKQLKELTEHPDELEEQLARIEATLGQHTKQLTTTEEDYSALANRRRELRENIEQYRDRRHEIGSLLERFSLLNQHYKSDIARLRGIEEAGTLFVVFSQEPCPLCGAEPAYQHHGVDCDGNVNAVVAAARSEISKINLLQGELGETIKILFHEAAVLDQQLPKVEQELQTLSDQVDQLISPKLSELRATYAELADKRGEVREALAVSRALQDIERRREDLNKNPETEKKKSSLADGDLPAAIAEGFAQKVEAILKDWHFPDANRVYFDAKNRDLTIAGKLRTARGKGLRAITHAAFTIGLLEYCRDQGTFHPGFVVLDSPLLAYRAPEGSEDDLTGTDLNERFYAYLSGLPNENQVIIVENTDPPSEIMALPQAKFFTKSPYTGRYGFFPTTS